MSFRLEGSEADPPAISTGLRQNDAIHGIRALEDQGSWVALGRECRLLQTESDSEEAKCNFTG
jgi:hypothetical protein